MDLEELALQFEALPNKVSEIHQIIRNETPPLQQFLSDHEPLFNILPESERVKIDLEHNEQVYKRALERTNYLYSSWFRFLGFLNSFHLFPSSYSQRKKSELTIDMNLLDLEVSSFQDTLTNIDEYIQHTRDMEKTYHIREPYQFKEFYADINEKFDGLHSEFHSLKRELFSHLPETDMFVPSDLNSVLKDRIEPACEEFKIKGEALNADNAKWIVAGSDYLDRVKAEYEVRTLVPRIKEKTSEAVRLIDRIKSIPETPSKKIKDSYLSYLPVIGALTTKHKAKQKALDKIEGLAHEGKIAGRNVHEIMYESGVNNSQTRKAVLKSLEEKGVTLDGKIESMYKVDSKLANFVNNIGVGKYKIGNIGNGLEFYKGANRWDSFVRNTKIGGEVSAMIQAIALATFGANIYHAIGAGTKAIEDHAPSGSYLAGAAGSILALSNIVNAGSITQAARGVNSVVTMGAGAAGTAIEGSSKKNRFMGALSSGLKKIVHIGQLLSQGMMLGYAAEGAYAQIPETSSEHVDHKTIEHHAATPQPEGHQVSPRIPSELTHAPTTESLAHANTIYSQNPEQNLEQMATPSQETGIKPTVQESSVSTPAALENLASADHQFKPTSIPTETHLEHSTQAEQPAHAITPVHSGADLSPETSVYNHVIGRDDYDEQIHVITGGAGHRYDHERVLGNISYDNGVKADILKEDFVINGEHVSKDDVMIRYRDAATGESIIAKPGETVDFGMDMKGRELDIQAIYNIIEEGHKLHMDQFASVKVH